MNKVKIEISTENNVKDFLAVRVKEEETKFKFGSKTIVIPSFWYTDGKVRFIYQ